LKIGIAMMHKIMIDQNKMNKYMQRMDKENKEQLARLDEKVTLLVHGQWMSSRINYNNASSSMSSEPAPSTATGDGFQVVGNSSLSSSV